MGKKRFFNFKNLFFVSFLAVAGIFSATAIIKDKQVEEAPVVEEAKAAAPSTGNFIYAAKPSGWGSPFKAYLWKNGTGTKLSDYPGSELHSIMGTSNIYYLDAGSNKNQYDRAIFNVNGDSCKTKDLYPNFNSNNFFRDMAQNQDWLNQTALQEFAFELRSSEDNNFGHATTPTFSTTGSFAHTYHISYTFSNTNAKFKIVYSGAWWGYDSLNQGGLDTTHISEDTGSGDENCVIDVPGTLDIWFTPAVTWYDNKNYIFDGSEGKITFTPATSAVTLNKQSGTGGSSSVTATYGSAMPAITAPTRDGYTFGGYFTETGGSGTKYYNADCSSAKNWDKTGAQTLYAKWTPAVYTITYDRNKNDDTQRTQSKNHDTSVTAYNPDSLITYNTKWNPSDGKSFVHWNTKYGDDGDVVLSGGTITTNKSFYLYYIEDWFEFRYKLGTGSWVEMSYNMTGAPSGIIAQFASDAQDLAHGQKFTFQVNKRDGSNHTDNWVNISPTYSGENNNYNTTTGIILSTNAQVYLKLTKSNGTYYYDVWVPGISLCTVVVGSESYSTNPDTSDQYVTTGLVRANNGDDVKVAFGGTPIDTYLDPSSASGCFSSDGEGTVTCTMTGEYTVYVKRGGGGKHDYIYISRDEAASAKYLAQIFNTTIGAICTDIESGSKGLSDLQNAWGSKSGTTLYNHFHGQIAATLAYFSTSSTTTDTDILACVARYDYIELKYGKTALPDFIGRNNGYQNVPRAISSFTPFDLVSDDRNNASTLIIIIASSVSLLSITALSILMVKKRKNKEQ